MSVEQVKAFLAKVKDDAALAQKLKDAQAAYTGDKETAIAEVIVPVAKSAGFNFTVEDIKADFKATFDNIEGEASEDELNAVAGGSDWCNGPSWTAVNVEEKCGQVYVAMIKRNQSPISF